MKFKLSAKQNSDGIPRENVSIVRVRKPQCKPQKFYRESSTDLVWYTTQTQTIYWKTIKRGYHSYEKRRSAGFDAFHVHVS